MGIYNLGMKSIHLPSLLAGALLGAVLMLLVLSRYTFAAANDKAALLYRCDRITGRVDVLAPSTARIDFLWRAAEWPASIIYNPTDVPVDAPSGK